MADAGDVLDINFPRNQDFSGAPHEGICILTGQQVGPVPDFSCKLGIHAT
jgi:hypothetical protein